MSFSWVDIILVIWDATSGTPVVKHFLGGEVNILSICNYLKKKLLKSLSEMHNNIFTDYMIQLLGLKYILGIKKIKQ